MESLRQMWLGATRLLAFAAVVMLALGPAGAVFAHAGHTAHAHLHGAKAPSGSAKFGLLPSGCDRMSVMLDRDDDIADRTGVPEPSQHGKAPQTDCCWTWHVSAVPAAASVAGKPLSRSSSIPAANRTAPPDVVPERLPEPPRPFA